MLFARTEKPRECWCFVGAGGGRRVKGLEKECEGSTRRNGRPVFHLRSPVKINYKLNDIFHFGQFNSINWYHSFVSFFVSSTIFSVPNSTAMSIPTRISLSYSPSTNSFQDRLSLLLFYAKDECVPHPQQGNHLGGK